MKTRKGLSGMVFVDLRNISQCCSGFNGAVLLHSNVLFHTYCVATATVHAKGTSTVFLTCTALAALMYMQQLKDNEISEIHTMYNCMSLAACQQLP